MATSFKLLTNSLFIIRSSQKLVFNAPFDHKVICYMRVLKPGMKRIGYAFKITKPKRINVSPPTVVLGPKEFVNVAIFCGAFDPGSEDTKGYRVTVQSTNAPDPPPATAAQEWTNTPDPAATVSSSSGSRETTWRAA
ncbi:hypothetical protein niasHT_032270 [Heterodera trifolii]|uniref:Major sperm protein n=1 Tax=Heterodera trifolii TaxID=157864 RepID=A0ABD2HZR3_9BILA